MIKLIATDVDGTLVKESSREVYDELIEVIDALTQKGIYFVVASGRQYASIRKMFERAKGSLGYIAENGAHIIWEGKNLAVTPMKREDVVGIMEDLRKFYGQNCHVTVSTPNGCLIESKSEEFISMIRDSYRNEVHLTEDILAEETDIIKLAIYKEGGIREIGESQLIPKWTDKVKTCMAGEEWVDFMAKGVDKGNALKRLQEELGIAKEETMAFGDNNNDLGMMLAAGESYAVENAVEEIKSAAKHSCPSYEKKGVCEILKTLL